MVDIAYCYFPQSQVILHWLTTKQDAPAQHQVGLSPPRDPVLDDMGLRMGICHTSSGHLFMQRHQEGTF
jgi:hypothetical protein